MAQSLQFQPRLKHRHMKVTLHSVLKLCDAIKGRRTKNELVPNSLDDETYAAIVFEAQTFFRFHHEAWSKCRPWPFPECSGRLFRKHLAEGLTADI